MHFFLKNKESTSVDNIVGMKKIVTDTKVNLNTKKKGKGKAIGLPK